MGDLLIAHVQFLGLELLQQILGGHRLAHQVPSDGIFCDAFAVD